MPTCQDPRGDAGRGGFDNGLDDHTLNRIDRAKQVPHISSSEFRRSVERLHALGPRPLGELLVELAACPALAMVVTATLNRYASIKPDIVYQLGANRWPPMPLHVVLP